MAGRKPTGRFQSACGTYGQGWDPGQQEAAACLLLGKSSEFYRKRDHPGATASHWGHFLQEVWSTGASCLVLTAVPRQRSQGLVPGGP